MLRGLTTVVFFAADHAAAKAWYTELFGLPPYYDKPGYFEFRIGDYQHEFGVVDARFSPHGTGPHDASVGPAGAIVYWAVDSVPDELERLLAHGAKPHDDVTDRGGNGYITASVVDPFGNVLGIMQNPHYVEVLGTVRP